MWFYVARRLCVCVCVCVHGPRAATYIGSLSIIARRPLQLQLQQVRRVNLLMRTSIIGLSTHSATGAG